ncbi:hypothetical protein [Methylobacterium sp. E-046]|uniref:hypothetical protein n=1 Tax=Methylobacterium sp. E-046 TaxID=2836576 RepID=UPI001FBA834E|nr:hypothetical protein [Methylobacterium sp. E-046]MCJ2102475.1 hypothetical protein [Methylobacterium sp. E-046]
MRRHLLAAIAAALHLATDATPSVARPRPRLPPGPNMSAFLRAGPIAPDGTLIRDGERLRTLELDDLTPLRLRFTILF